MKTTMTRCKTARNDVADSEGTQPRSPAKKHKMTAGKEEKETSGKEVGEEEDDGDPELDKKMPANDLIKTTPIKKKKTMWNKIKEAVELKAKGYKETEIFGEDETLHEHTKRAIRIYAKAFGFDVGEKLKQTLKPMEWVSIFKGALGRLDKKQDTFDPEEKEHLQMLAARLSRTTPEAMGPLMNDGKMTMNHMTTAWDGARATLGSDWVTKKDKPESILRTTKGPSKAKTGTRWADTTKPPPKTPQKLKQTELTIMRKRHERFDLMLKPTPGEKYTKELMMGKLVRWFTEVKVVDPRARILPWKKGSRDAPIDKPDRLPEDVRELRKYFDQIKFTQGKWVWTKVHITFDVLPEQIASGPDSEVYFYDEDNDALRVRPLRESDDVAEIGVMTATGNFTDVERFMKMVTEAIKGEKYGIVLGGKTKKCKELEVSIEERQAYMASKQDAWKMQYWDIVHVMVDRKNKELAVERLLKTFNTRGKPLPEGLTTRFIPHKAEAVLSPRGLKARRHAFNLHIAALKDLRVINVTDILELDEEDTTTGTTLRKFLAGILHSDTGRPLFHNIDRGTGRNDGETTVTIAIFTEHLEEAEPIAGVLPALAEQRLGESTRQWFGARAHERCVGVRFAKTGNTFVAANDECMYACGEDDYGIDNLSDDEEDVDIVIPEELADEMLRDRQRHGRPEDSVYTMGGKSIASIETEDTKDKTEDTSTLTTDENRTLRDEVHRLKERLAEHGIGEGGGSGWEREDMELEEGEAGAAEAGLRVPSV